MYSTGLQQVRRREDAETWQEQPNSRGNTTFCLQAVQATLTHPLRPACMFPIFLKQGRLKCIYQRIGNCWTIVLSIAKSKGMCLGSRNAGQDYQTLITHWRATASQGGFQVTAKVNWTQAPGHSFWIMWLIRSQDGQWVINVFAVLVTAKSKALSTFNGHPSNVILMSNFRRKKNKKNYHHQEHRKSYSPFNTIKHNLSELARS